jgi:uncharacterized protein (TIGR02421 family)
MKRQVADIRPEKSLVWEFGPSGSLRQPVGKSGRIHVDRWLPFIILNRGDEGSASLARRIAIESPSYLVWPTEDDEPGLEAMREVIPAMAAKAGRLLVISLDDRSAEFQEEGSQALPGFAAQLGAGDQGDVGRAARALETAMRAITIDLRRCKVERTPFAPLLPKPFDRALNEIDGVERLSLSVPQIHRRPEGGEYPGIAHDLATGIGDALLRAACAFLDDGKAKAPVHYRALGRSAYLAAALKADRKLDTVARSFDFLLSVSPIDTDKAFDRFIAEGEGKPPHFHYRPLTIDPDEAKRKLYAIDFRALEDPLLERLLSEKRHELDAQLTMLATRNTPAFQSASIFLYGSINADLLEDAAAILAGGGSSPPRGESIGASEIAAAAAALSQSYRVVDPAFAPDIQVRDDIAGLMVSGSKLFVGTNVVIPANRLQALLAHEVSIHLLTHFNGAAQRLAIFRTGLAGYEGIQEGLGVFAEWATGGLTRTRLRLLAARVIAVAAMERGANFIDVYRTLRREHGFSRRGAFGIAARVFRSGGFAKDAIYLQGFREVTNLVAAGAPLNPFWLGKIALPHVPAIEELLQRELVRPPLFKPLFLEDETTTKRIDGLRQAKSFPELVGA